MAIIWPPAVPFLTDMRNARRSGPQGNKLRTQMSVGPAKVRARTTFAVQTYAASSPAMSAAQFATFEAFYRDTLAGGVLAFTATDPLTCADRVFRFVEGYEVRHGGGNRYVTATLEVLA